MQKKILIITGLYILSLMMLGGSCGKDQPCNQYPDTYVNIFIQPNTLDFIPDGSYVYLTANPPSRGIIVYRPYHDEFLAYERTCPYDPYDCCNPDNAYDCSALIVESSGIIAKDTCCGSRYLLTDGSVIEGPSVCPLYQYQTVYDGIYLHIFN
jgi:nitrite reductase/ring-hydroxylating ferredoxin subunit